jgi:hypothetical protein
MAATGASHQPGTALLAGSQPGQTAPLSAQAEAKQPQNYHAVNSSEARSGALNRCASIIALQ